LTRKPQAKQVKQEKRLAQSARLLSHNKRELKNSGNASSGKKPKPQPKAKTGGIKDGMLKKLFGTSKPPHTAQQSIPYLAMYKDGICHANERLYNKTLTFGDVNYQLAHDDDQQQIFDSYSKFLNYFDHTMSVQLSFINNFAGMQDFEGSINIPQRDDDYNSIRREYSDMLKNQLAKGNNGLVKNKYITFGIEAANLREAKPKLERIEAEILSNFARFGVIAKPLTGKERLKLLHSQLHPDGKEPFRFDWPELAKTGMSTKDFIAPTSFDFRGGKTFRMGAEIGAVSYLQILAPELSDRLLAEFLNMENAITVSMHLKSIDRQESIKLIKRKITDLDAMKIVEQKKAVRAGYDMEIIPSDLAVFGQDAKNLLEEVQNNGERMFLVTVVVLNTAGTKRKLENDIFAASGIAQKYNCGLKRLDFLQEQGLLSSLVLGQNQVEIQRGLTTSSTAIFIPFTTQELFQSGQALYYGINALSNNLIMADRKQLSNPNGLILGTPGSGKSFLAKRSIVNAFLITNDDCFIIDPEAEYYPLVSRLGGQIIKLSATGTDYINPLDINLNIVDPDTGKIIDPLPIKSEFILSLCELIIGGAHGLSPAERTIIDRCVPKIYERYFADPIPENMPVLEDLYNTLRGYPEQEAQHIATAIEIYVKGSLRVFNNRTNVDVNSRLICYDIKSLGHQLKKLGMLIVQEALWTRVSANRTKKKGTWFFVDEFHLLLKEEQTAKYSVEFWKRFRKWGGIPTGITQNVKDLLFSPEVQNIFDNSDSIVMLNQAAGDREILASALGISEHQLSYITQSEQGAGLLFHGNVIIPFIDRFPKDTELYRIMTTKPTEVAENG